MQEVQDHVTKYVNLQTRQAQNAVQMYHFVIESLSADGRLRIIAEKDKYTVKVNNVEYPNGPMLFKLVMSRAIVDTKSTASHMQGNLMNLTSYISTIDSDIVRFNEYVKIQREGLLARGQTVDHLLLCVFNGYVAASDGTFVKYIQGHLDQHNDGTRDYTVDTLMTMALNKYKDMVRDGVWNAMSAEQEQIVALSVTIDKIKDANLKLSKQLSSPGTKSKGGSDKKSSNKDSKNKSGNTPGKKDKGKSFKAQQNEKYAWKKKKPSDGDPKKSVNGKSYHYMNKDDKAYYWCEWHEAWVMHLPEDEGENGCQLRKNIHKEESNGKSKKTKFSSAIATILEQVDDDEEE